jgi:hypothetical protein
MGGQHERLRRIKALSTAITNTPNGLTLVDLQRNFKDWGCTEAKMREYTKYLIDVGDITGERIPNHPEWPNTYDWDYHYLFKPKTATTHDSATSAQGGVVK